MILRIVSILSLIILSFLLVSCTPEPVINAPQDNTTLPPGYDDGSNGPEQFLCEDNQRNVDSCIEIYDPVCGWFDQTIKCIKYPCAAEYSNSCFACKDKKVAYYTKGLCPQ